MYTVLNDGKQHFSRVLSLFYERHRASEKMCLAELYNMRKLFLLHRFTINISIMLLSITSHPREISCICILILFNKLFVSWPTPPGWFTFLQKKEHSPVSLFGCLSAQETRCRLRRKSFLFIISH